MPRWSALQALGFILVLAALTFGVTFACDALVFRSGFYTQWLAPNSSAGTFENKASIGRRYPLKSDHRVLLLGDSQMAEGFSDRQADQIAGADWQFLNLAVPGATYRDQFYLLRSADPQADRFNVIVIALAGYVDFDKGEIVANRVGDLNWTIASLRFSDIPEFVRSFRDSSLHPRILAGALLKGIVLRKDFRDLLRSFRIRMQSVADQNGAALQSKYNGNPASLAGASLNWPQRRFAFPSTMPIGVQQHVRENCDFDRWRVAGYERRFREHWIGKMIDHYRQKKTDFIVTGLPYRPFPNPINWPVKDAYVETLRRQERVTVLPEALFADLQRPDLFFDALHLNRAGRLEMTERLTQAIVRTRHGKAF